MNVPRPDQGPAHGHYAAQQAASGLDARAAQLRPDAASHLDRRAIALLAGIVVLLVCAIVAMLRALGGGQAPGPERAQDLVIPEAPKVAPPSPQEAPAVAAMPPPAPPPLQPPPLPVVPLAPAMPSYGRSPEPARHPGRSLAERRGGAGEATTAGDPYLTAMLAGLHTPAPAASAASEPATTPSARATAARPLQRPDMLLVRGTHIRCVLQTRIVTDVPGETACVVAAPVYSVDGRRLLVPEGSRVLGRYGGAPTGPRVAVVWDRILTPTGLDVTMASPGVDGLGGAGHPGDYDAHWGARIGSAMLVSLLGDAFKYAAAQEGPPGTLIGEGGVVVRSPYESATARTLERLAGQALEVRRPPTVTLVQGTLVNIHVARDVDFSAVMGSPP